MLDQSPVPAGSTPSDALANSLALARHVDALGYTRLWYSEHHAMDLLACTAPEILITRAAAETSRIRVGSGGIMLPHYAALKVAEVFRTLNAMFPNRIDLGIGRAPGGGQLESYALRRNRKSPNPDDFPEQLAELRAFLHPEWWGTIPDSGLHPFAKIRVAPDAPGAPDLWLLGSSMWSAVTAAQQGLPYAFAHFFSPIQTRQAIEYYQQNFIPEHGREICSHQPRSHPRHRRHLRRNRRRSPPFARLGPSPPAPHPHGRPPPRSHPRRRPPRTQRNPHRPNPFLAFTAGSLDAPEDNEWPRYLVGTPDKVAAQLRGLASELNLHEVIVNTITHSHEARLRFSATPSSR